MRLSILSLALTAALVRARLYKDTPHKVKESIESHPQDWVKQDRTPAHHFIQLKIALPQPHFPILEKHLLEASDPKHHRYGDYLSKEQTDVLMAPHAKTLNAVNEWLSWYGIEEEHLHRSSAQDWVTVRVPVYLAEEMLDTKYYTFTHSDSGKSIVRTTSYSLPESLHEHVELIQPTIMFARPRTLASTAYRLAVSGSGSSTATGTITGPAGNQVDASCSDTSTITCLRQLYNAVGYNTSATNGNKIAVTAYLDQYANNDDLQQFFQLENPAAYKSNYTLVSVKGGLNNQSYAAAGMEANLDTQYAFGLTYPTPAIFYSTGGLPPFNPDINVLTDSNEPYSDWVEYMLSLSNEELPQTISTSYGDDEQTVPFSYANRVCQCFAALGARGVSILFASGDGGVCGVVHDPQGCVSNDGKNKTMFIPSFPASCPYVTSVGATQLIPETSANFSGGGFSNYFPRPDYQKAAVSKYLAGLTPGTHEGLYNTTGRGFPDVSAQGYNFTSVYQGEPIFLFGTSCSTPTFASIIAFLNDARVSAGKPGLGFLNQWLYEVGYAGLNDITTGYNLGYDMQGFNATVGWDPVTGLGTPNFWKLLELVE